MTHPTQHTPAPEVELDPAAEHLTRHVSTVTSTALAGTQHAMQSATLRAYLARDTASAEARATHRALRAQQQIARTTEVTDRAGVAPVPADPSASPVTRTATEAATGQWTAYADGAEAAALGGRGVSTPPEHVLAHVDAQTRTGTPAATPAAGATTAAELGTGVGTGLDTGSDPGQPGSSATPAPTPGIEP